MNSAYFFMFAVIIAVLGIAVNFKIHIEKLKEDPSRSGSIQSKFFIGVALVEAIPIILVVIGFTKLTTVSSFNEILLPGIITIITALFGILFVFLQSKVDVTKASKGVINTFTYIGIMLIMAFPIIAIVSMMTMLNGG